MRPFLRRLRTAFVSYVYCVTKNRIGLHGMNAIAEFHALQRRHAKIWREKVVMGTSGATYNAPRACSRAQPISWCCCCCICRRHRSCCKWALAVGAEDAHLQSASSHRLRHVHTVRSDFNALTHRKFRWPKIMINYVLNVVVLYSLPAPSSNTHKHTQFNSSRARVKSSNLHWLDNRFAKCSSPSCARHQPPIYYNPLLVIECDARVSIFVAPGTVGITSTPQHIY